MPTTCDKCKKEIIGKIKTFYDKPVCKKCLENLLLTTLKP